MIIGIAGLSIGLHRAGIETVAFCENDKPCKKILKEHWPSIPIFHNVQNLRYENGMLLDSISGEHLRTEVDMIVGGFPCTDISIGGKMKGLYDKKLYQKCLDDGMDEDEAKRYAKTRSGLWFEYARLINEIRPRWVIIENVDRLVEVGLKEVLHDLAKLRYDVEWGIIITVPTNSAYVSNGTDFTTKTVLKGSEVDSVVTLTAGLSVTGVDALGSDEVTSDDVDNDIEAKGLEVDDEDLVGDDNYSDQESAQD